MKHIVIRALESGLLALAINWTCGAGAQTLPLGALAHDGPATPEQLSLVIPVTGSLPTAATATVRYKQSTSGTWITGHPLFRVRPSFSNSSAVGTVNDVFAWPILDLTPGTAYDVEVTVTSAGVSEVKTATFTTRSLPPAAGVPNKTIAAGASSGTIQAAFDGLNAGDVIEFQNGTYNVSNLSLNRSGTVANPIYIRGASRIGVILSDTTDIILALQNANHVVIENLTLRGSNTDGGVSSGHTGISGGRSFPGTVRNTIRNVSIIGVDRGINFYSMVNEALIYDNTLIGNNLWNATFFSDNRTWDDDGINVPGLGNVAFNNSISRFGDSMAYAQHVGNDTITYTAGVHFYRNDIRNSGDDMVEFDHAHRNLSFYDNRSHNSSNCGSLDPLYGGPLVYARSICINAARVNTHKWNDQNTGQFLYNNTFILTSSVVGSDVDVSGWYQPNNGPQRAYGYRNNIHVYRGNGNMLWLESGGHDPIDWTNNSWYPDRGVQWGGLYGTLAAARTGLPNTTPVFSGTNRRMENDNITVANPWTTTITLGANAFTEVTDAYTPELAAGTTPKNSGAVIPNITDGFTGAAPDRGAIISGRPMPVWGDRTQGAALIRPNPPTNLSVN